MRLTPQDEISTRIRRLQAALRGEAIDAALLVQNADLFYFAGTVQRSHLFVPAEGEPLLMVGRSFERARRESPLERVVPLNSPRELSATIKAGGAAVSGRIGLELDILPYNHYARYRQMFGNCEVVDVSPLVRSLRMIKSPYEISIMREGGRLSSQIFAFAREVLKPGLTELAFTGLIEGEARRLGHPGTMRARGFNQNLVYTLFSSGENLGTQTYLEGPVGGLGTGPAYPNAAGRRVIGANEPLLLDFSFVHEGYTLDQTRIFCIGAISDRLAEAHAAALGIMDRLVSGARPGAVAGELYAQAIEMASASGFGAHFMGYPQPVPFIGHGVGIEVDELPVFAPGFRTRLAEGMVFALEPKFVFSEGAVGIEDTFVVTADGLENLTPFPGEIIRVT